MTAEHRPRLRYARRWAQRAGLPACIAALLLFVTACGGVGRADVSGPETAATGASGDPAAVVRIKPGDGAEDVATSKALKVSAASGRLTSVEVTDLDGNRISGILSADESVWHPEGVLRTATQYTVRATAENASGRPSAARATFTTVDPEQTFIGRYVFRDGATVGVGMPVSLRFSVPIEDRAAVEEAVQVTAEPAVEIVGHWFGDERLDFRPRTYWQPGTEVRLRLRLDGVEGADGVYGIQYKDVHFTVGRSQVSVVDVAAHTMTVKRAGEEDRVLQISAGEPGKDTWNGVMVVSDKDLETRMNGDTVGYVGAYDYRDVPHAMRLTRSGTYVHGAYWGDAGRFGRRNTSHGCIGLYDVQGADDPGTPAAWFYDHSLIGDVVQVVNSGSDTVAPDNGLNGWNMPWDEWTAGSSTARAS